MSGLAGRTLVVATHNEGKRREFAELFAPFGVEVRSAAEWGLPEPAETGTTFEENALIKAQAASLATGLPALSDDSGLCIDALGGAPGVYTADWATLPEGGRDFGQAMERAEREMEASGDPSRRGRFVSVICLSSPEGEAEYFRGEVEGELVWPPRGEKGFGYDPMFLPDGHARTFGEMISEEKHGLKADGSEPLSHRARAFQKFARLKLGAV